MTTRFQIRCINKDDRYDPHERIQQIGGYDGGNHWKITQQQAVNDIKSGKHAFYVVQGNREVNVIVARSRYGNDYIKTEADGDAPNNLLSLMECK